MTWRATIRRECLDDGGLMEKIRVGNLDEEAYQRLLDAIEEGTREVANAKTVDRMTVACLFEVPYEIENVRHAYESDGAADVVDRMAMKLRMAIHEFLWAGLDSEYKV